jgi:cell wall assembly regulator SMI1
VISIHFCNPSSPAASLRIKDTRPGQALGHSVTQKMMDSGLAHQVGRSITGGIRYTPAWLSLARAQVDNEININGILPCVLSTWVKRVSR